MTKGESVCQEFCEEVEVGTTLHCTTSTSSLVDAPLDWEEAEELKCKLDIDHFDVLAERMVALGYCCTQVQNDKERKKCFAWFEPQ